MKARYELTLTLKNFDLKGLNDFLNTLEESSYYDESQGDNAIITTEEYE